MTQARVLAATAALLLVAGCSGGSSTTPTPSAAPTTETSSAAPSPSAAACPEGAYRVVGFEGRGRASAAGKGSGGDVDATFSAGTFTIRSDGAEPVTLDLGPTNAEVRFSGEIVGTYAGDPSALRLTTQTANGDATVKSFGFTRTFSAGGLADQLIGAGVTAQVTCDDAAGTATVVLPDATLDLARR